MPVEETVDEVVNLRGATGGGLAARSVTRESVDPETGVVKSMRGSKIEQDDAPQTGTGRRFKASTEALLAKLEAPPGEEGDPDEDEGADDASGDANAAGGETDADPSEGADGGDADEADEGDEGEGGEEGEGEEDKKPDEKQDDTGAADEVKAWQSKAEQYEVANRRLMSELEAAKKTPAKQRSEYEQMLVDADEAYVNKGSVEALRMFIGAVIGAKPDSKEVDAELSGLYGDLTERELNVPLDQSQKAMREAQRARLALARDKREKAEREKQPAAVNSDHDQRIGQAANFIDNQLTAKSQGGKSIAEQYPLLVSLAEEIDGVKPGELLARAIDYEIKIGGLTGAESNEAMIHHAAKQIEAYYTAKTEKISKATSPKKTDTTSGTQAAKPASKEQRQKPGARTINNATASVAPATPPKQKKTETKPKTEKTRKDFKSDRQWQDHLMAKHNIPNR